MLLDNEVVCFRRNPNDLLNSFDSAARWNTMARPGYSEVHFFDVWRIGERFLCESFPARAHETEARSALNLAAVALETNSNHAGTTAVGL